MGYLYYVSSIAWLVFLIIMVNYKSIIFSVFLSLIAINCKALLLFYSYMLRETPKLGHVCSASLIKAVYL